MGGAVRKSLAEKERRASAVVWAKCNWPAQLVAVLDDGRRAIGSLALRRHKQAQRHQEVVLIDEEAHVDPVIA